MPDPYIVMLLGLGVSVLMVAWLPLALRKLPLSLAIMCVLFGAAVFAVGGLKFDPDPRAYGTLVEKLCEVVVIISLMGAGLKLDRPIDFRAWATTWRLLGIAMPLTIAAVALLGHGIGLSIGAALLFGAAVAPTDPVLASDVQVGKPILIAPKVGGAKLSSPSRKMSSVTALWPTAESRRNVHDLV